MHFAWTTRTRLASAAGAALLLAGTLATGAALAETKTADFDMVVSPGAAQCLPNARGEVHIRSLGPVEVMTVEVRGLPPKTEFDLFVIQVPNAPFGVSWYQGDMQTNDNGRDQQRFIGRFNIETFALSPGIAAPPQVHTDGPFPDATEGVAFKPIHTYHLGLWFNSPADAQKAGCPGGTTPFNGEHNAGIQVLNTANFPNDQGPLRQVEP
jgi:hypothetical protein